MKRLLLLITALLLSVAAMAQNQLLEIVPSSFAPVQTDMVSGIAIDKIAPDLSRRPCARIKMHINRMTADDIAKLSVRPVGGNVVVMKQVVASEGNGLIVELTAKEQTRFYLHHDKYGDSNEVSLNLEGNKEYKLEAQLNITYPIAVFCNARNAEVYLDDVFKGNIDSKYSLTIGEVFPGAHKLKVVSGAMSKEEEIMVDTQHIHFRINIPLEQARPQYVVFQVSPKNSAVVIDNKDYTPDEYGQITAVLNNGSYTYTVSARHFHPQTGTFVVDGKKVEQEVKLKKAYGWLKVSGAGALSGANVYVDGAQKGTAPTSAMALPSGKHTVRIVQKLYKTFEAEVEIKDDATLTFSPDLVADFAHVSISSLEGSVIYVNNERKGLSPWSGDLASGAYIFEARKTGHQSSAITKNIVSEPQKQSYKIPDPKPILGTLNIKSSPAMADVTVDGKPVGRTPLMYECIIGTHSVTISKNGFYNAYKTVSVAEGKTTNINESLSEKKSLSSSGSSYSSSSSSRSNSYSSYSSSAYKSTGSSSSRSVGGYSPSKQRKQSGSWDSFNLGLWMGLGGSTPFSNTSTEYRFDFNAGLMLRMWSHETLFNAMIGGGYMRTADLNFVVLPMIVNWNFVRNLADASMYLGIGTEATFAFGNTGIYESGYTYIDFPVVLQWGMGWRHSDCAVYLKFFTQHELLTIGVRYAYLF